MGRGHEDQLRHAQPGQRGGQVGVALVHGDVVLAGQRNLLAVFLEIVVAYADIRHALENLCGVINGDYSELDWMPVRYIHRTVARKRVPGLCRAAAVGLVTPLRDGMNLVAKEYVAAQDPADPGVLVLSRFAGAAEEGVQNFV